MHFYFSIVFYELISLFAPEIRHKCNNVNNASKTSVLMGSILGDMSKKAKGPGAVSLESLKAQLEASSGSGIVDPIFGVD